MSSSAFSSCGEMSSSGGISPTGSAHQEGGALSVASDGCAAPDPASRIHTSSAAGLTPTSSGLVPRCSLQYISMCATRRDRSLAVARSHEYTLRAPKSTAIVRCSSSDP